MEQAYCLVYIEHLLIQPHNADDSWNLMKTVSLFDLFLTFLRFHPKMLYCTFQFSSVQSLSHVQLFATPWTAACQVSLSITNSWSLLKLKSSSWQCHPTILNFILLKSKSKTKRLQRWSRSIFHKPLSLLVYIY